MDSDKADLLVGYQVVVTKEKEWNAYGRAFGFPWPDRPITNHVNFANNHNGKFVYVTIGGANQVKVFRRGATPELVATIPVGSLPHGIWPSGDGSRVYVVLENDGMATVIDTLTNKVIANIPIGQTTQALVYVPNAVRYGSGTDNLAPLGEAANTARCAFASSKSKTLPDAQATVAVNSLGLLDLVVKLRRKV